MRETAGELEGVERERRRQPSVQLSLQDSDVDMRVVRDQCVNGESQRSQS
jgi:hypothetical protein